MRLLTWNVQGLGGPLFRRYRGRLRQDLHRDFTGGSIDILLIQEHRLNVERISEYGTFLPGNWEMFWSEAYGPYASKGGVCISVAEHWKSLILHKEVLVQGRAQCVLLQLEGEVWGVLNIYAPNQASNRKRFWIDMYNKIPQANHWCVGGDFNMLEDPSDRTGGNARTIRGMHGRD